MRFLPKIGISKHLVCTKTLKNRKRCPHQRRWKFVRRKKYKFFFNFFLKKKKKILLRRPEKNSSEGGERTQRRNRELLGIARSLPGPARPSGVFAALDGPKMRENSTACRTKISKNRVLRGNDEIWAKFKKHDRWFFRQFGKKSHTKCLEIA